MYCIILLIIKTRILEHNKQLKKHTIVLKKQNRSIFNFKKSNKKISPKMNTSLVIKMNKKI